MTCTDCGGERAWSNGRCSLCHYMEVWKGRDNFLLMTRGTVDIQATTGGRPTWPDLWHRTSKGLGYFDQDERVK